MSTDSPTKDEVVQQLGQTIVTDPEYGKFDWQGVALMVTRKPTERRMTGYLYLADGTFSATRPGNNRKIKDLAGLLQQVMEDETGARWLKCLIHVWKPGPEIDIQFEYDDPERWKIQKVSLDMSDYAESLRPPRMARAE